MASLSCFNCQVFEAFQLLSRMDHPHFCCYCCCSCLPNERSGPAWTELFCFWFTKKTKSIQTSTVPKTNCFLSYTSTVVDTWYNCDKHHLCNGHKENKDPTFTFDILKFVILTFPQFFFQYLKTLPLLLFIFHFKFQIHIIFATIFRQLNYWKITYQLCHQTYVIFVILLTLVSFSNTQIPDFWHQIQPMRWER